MAQLSSDGVLLPHPQILKQLPPELVEILRTGSSIPETFLDTLSIAALQPNYTNKLFTLYEPIFVDLAARWICLDSHEYYVQVTTAFARILPFAPYLRPFVNAVFQRLKSSALPSLSESNQFELLQMEGRTLHAFLVALFRLLSFDLDTFSPMTPVSQLQSLLSHHNPVIRYLAIRCFCLYMRAADASLEQMISKYHDGTAINGSWEDRTIDYRLLSIWEEKRWAGLKEELENARISRDDSVTETWTKEFRNSFTSHTAEIGGVLLPTIHPKNNMGASCLVETPTVRRNLRSFGNSLLSMDPLLLVGLAGSGKTSLVHAAANRMGHSSSMITLHLNEQTDSKSLLGLYSTSPQAGSFSWQPGVLTKAAREGRWVLIEDLDRAPSEVIGLILPLIEKRELIIPSRKERIRCADNFRVIATMRSTINAAGKEITPGTNMLGSRLWNHIQVASMPLSEVKEVIIQRFPLLSPRVDIIMTTFDRITSLFNGTLSRKFMTGRLPNLRDLVKLCYRIERRLRNLGCETGYEAVPEGTHDELFMDTVDIFAACFPKGLLQSTVAGVIAEGMQISPQRMNFCLSEQTPKYLDSPHSVTIGRECCQKRKPLGLRKSSSSTAAHSTFAPTRASLRIMEQIASALQLSEPVLLVGETGIGKTAVIQQLASLLHQRLTVVNLSQQSESTDLLGGFKPVNVRSIAVPLVDEFNSLFESTFSAKKNLKFLASVAKCVTTGNWRRLVNILKEAIKMASGIFESLNKSKSELTDVVSEQPSKKRKLDDTKYTILRGKWATFSRELKEFEVRVSEGDSKFAFAFVQGKIVKALRNGEWVLLDEINLASPDTLESIASLLHYGGDGTPSVLLSEAGEVERIYGDSNFRIFGAMNPATDAGKRDLVPGLRSRFTEIYVNSPDTEIDDLITLIGAYLGSLAIADEKATISLARLYLDTKKLNVDNKLTDGAGQKPHFTIRTLVRCLIYVRNQAHIYGLRRAMYEGFSMSFLTLLSKASKLQIIPLLDQHIFGSLKNSRSILSQTPKPPNDGATYVQFKHYWMRQGEFPLESQPHYIITPFIERNLMNLVRASSTRLFPILLQGPTSSGKTSMVEYLAKISGNRFVRINNHEHTDLQEYLGSYVSGEDGSLKYQEGILVEALRNGYWIVLDELNLAPTDVLEALNRLLDDNRELFLPESQEVIRPNPNFMLFATQNPAGLYGGRKVLSRAFRNRFLELHFDDIPEDELEYILKERSQIPPSFCARIVSVYRKLSLLRQSSRLFEQRNSFATLRDLFRWAQRRADDREQLAVNGFMLLAERVRNPQERAAVKEVIEEVMRVKLDQTAIYSSRCLDARLQQLSATAPTSIIWTQAMRRVFILVSQAIEHNEPVLLVGETGCGKTQICQAIAEIYGKQLFTINAHVNLETGDIVGAQRPLRNRSTIEAQLLADLSAVLKSIDAYDESSDNSIDKLTTVFSELNSQALDMCEPNLINRIRENMTRAKALFEWSNGSLITAMECGQHFLLDEISLADDSVLERLNSVLEPHRSLLLAEKGPINLVVAKDGFQFLATMNPGGDYGKRELSAALRNRLTEIWVPQLSEAEDILPILSSKLVSPISNAPSAMLAFARWFKETSQSTSSTSISIRDLLAWVGFVNQCKDLDQAAAVVHGAALVYIDTLGANPSAMFVSGPANLKHDRLKCLERLGEIFGFDAVSIYYQATTISMEDNNMRIGPFVLEMSTHSEHDPTFSLEAPTTVANSLRIARGLQLTKPILLEGSPGVGKTTLVAALAQCLGKPLTRINLSDQTDLTDLFGSDVPVEGGDMGNFAWSDAPFLRAMQTGGWVLLDEMNLASQSVLEGLNSCLDHRQQVYVAELDQTFKRHPDFVLFAAQNPHHQGGGRKGLPASFVNRFTVVYADSFSDDDLKMICKRLSPLAPEREIQQLVEFVSSLNIKITNERLLGTTGGPWEINLRDISRWLRLLESTPIRVSPSQFLDVVISQRFRTHGDRSLVLSLYEDVFRSTPVVKSYFHNLSVSQYQVGLSVLQRDPLVQNFNDPQMKILTGDLAIMESLALCIEQGWPSILVGTSGCGKTTILRKLATLSGCKLVELSLNADTDTMDLVGGFEQVDNDRHLLSFMDELNQLLQNQVVSTYTATEQTGMESELVQLYQDVKSGSSNLETISEALHRISLKGLHPSFTEFYNRSKTLLKSSFVNQTIGFEWTEGIFVQSVQKGDWVVLDNANLCNPSVLDRLNSLMEPNGYLVINEQRTGDGTAKVVKPHPNFRLFLTMDPRHGELSRAMRNRAIEICLQPGVTGVMYQTFDRYSTFLSRDTLSSLKDFLCDGSWNEHKFSSFRYGIEPLHPLINEPRAVACIIPESQVLLAKLAKLQEIQFDVWHFHQVFCQVRDSLSNKNPSEMSRLERSVASNRIPTLMKESTQPVAFYLSSCIQALSETIQKVNYEVLRSVDVCAMASSILELCWDIFGVVQTNNFDEGLFQTYLQIGQSLCSRFRDIKLDLVRVLSESLDMFRINWGLTTGQSMQRIWDQWRPATPTDPAHLKSMVDLQHIAARFDLITLKTNLPFSQLGEMRHSLVQAQISMLQGADGVGLIHDLQHVIDDLEARVLDSGPVSPPYFSLEFEALSQYRDFIDISKSATETINYGLSDVLQLLAGRPSYPHDMSTLGNPVPDLLSRVSRFSGFQNDSSKPLALRGIFSLSLIAKLASLGIVPVKGMNILNSELDFIANGLCSSTDQIARDQLDILQKQLARLLQELLRCHGDLIDPVSLGSAASYLDTLVRDSDLSGLVNTQIPPLKLRDNSDKLHYFNEFASRSFNKIVSSLVGICGKTGTTNHLQLGAACIHLAMACLRFFVPNRPFDPSLGLAVQRHRYTQRVQEKNKKLNALKAYELSFSGQESSIRIRIAQEELRLLGDIPPSPPVIRPQPSQIGELQGEFSNLLNSVVNLNPDGILRSLQDSANPDLANTTKQQGELLQKNIQQICLRLTTNYKAYEDVVIPVIRFLEILHLGVDLVQCSDLHSHLEQGFIHAMSQITPLMSCRRVSLPDLQHRPSRLSNSEKVDIGLQRLSILWVFQNTDPETLSTAANRQLLRDTFEDFSSIWKQQLEDDQNKHYEMSNLYRYRGSFEDDQEIEAAEVSQLFPKFDGTIEDDLEIGTLAQFDVKTISLRLSHILNNLFSDLDKESTVKRLLLDSTKLLGINMAKSSTDIPIMDPKSHLLGAILFLDDVKSIKQPTSYNFYSSPNLVEVKKLADLVETISVRFKELQNSWPEHATIADVIRCCSEIFQFNHREPLAKFITKAEKLHSFIYEWQAVASKNFSVTQCYDNITALLISWRRIELSTWSRLLDIEDEKCSEDASAWWFVAYDVIIAAPLQLVQDGQPLIEHSVELITTLEKFICSTPMGQYKSRLQLIEKFKMLLTLYALDFPALDQLSAAIDNLLHHYFPFVSVFEKSLGDGRKTLERDIQQTIQLAIWKDTNINALRESARRSHNKLFKVVRKYRSLLSQSSESLLSKGLSSLPDKAESFSDNRVTLPNPVSPVALRVCHENIQSWSQKPMRFTDPDAAVRSMQRVYENSLNGLQAHQELDAFTRDIIDTIAEFKSQTPKTLTEDNKHDVQHLKGQKRRFYAEKLKDLRFMGIRSNVGTDILESQRSVASVLSSTLPLTISAGLSHVKSADSYFHKFLDLVPRVRISSVEYSEDLSNVEATRSAGFIEGLLHWALKQRETLSLRLENLTAVELTLQQMRNVSDLRSSLLPNSDYLLSDRRDLRGTLRWLSTILGVCNSTLQIHGYFAGIGSSEVLEALNDWKIRLNNLLVSIEDLKILPPGLSTGTHEKLFSSVRMLVSNVRADILKWIDVHPELNFALEQILPWTELGVTASTREANGQINISLEEFDSSLFTVMDKIFVVMQKISSSLSTAPPSKDIPAWLVKTEQVISKACAELHMADIVDDIRCVLARIRHVSEKDSNSLAVVGAAISAIMPIAEQYQSICTDILHRYSALHRETCKMSYLLAKSFNQIASEGFCAPPENAGEHGKSDKLETGTGLGDGEGAEDISKDVQDDEDLADLAQEKQQMDGDKEDKDTGVDAVNMDQEDLEADRSDFDDEIEKDDGSFSDKEDEDDMDLDEETGSVDRLDASAVDEKMWDGTNDQDQKDTENEQGKGDAESEDKTAASANKNEKINESKNGDESENEGSEPPDDEGEAVGREDMDTTDPHAKEEPILDLPEDMELDGQDDKDKQDTDFEDDLGDLSDDNRSNWEGEPNAPEESNDHPDLDSQEQAESETEPANEVKEENLNGQEGVECHQEESETGTEEKERDELLESKRTDNQADAEDIAPSEEVSVGQGVDQDQNQEHGDSGKATQEHGSKDQADEQNLQGSADQGEDGKEATNVSGGRDDGKLDDSQTQAFKKLGDILEQWHRRQRQIQEASDHQDTSQNENQDANMEDADFEHLADDQDAADTQALGQATEEQAKSLDQSNAVESDVRPEEGEFPSHATEPENPPAEQSLEDRMDLDQQPGLSENNTSRSYVAGDRITENDPTHQDSQTSDSQEMEDVDAHLSSFHVGSESAPLTSPEEARRLWSHYESITHDLSLALTEQLRLILAPTLATKLRGDFRTGKRLNIKRIIPYIASQYKRDKIWMRRSVPSKRSYQIMLAVDDSKSMLESGSGQLAFETLALITKSLSMLEAGDLCVVSFGDEDHVRVAHEFGKTFSSEAGVQIFQQFSYKQTGTNVRKLISDSIALFREAKMKRSRSSGSEDLWQLELIISDGICEDHETIRRLVRQAQEERIMIVFIIVDAVKGSSILDLTQASFEPDGSGAGEMKLKMKRYLEGFPFSYYLVVRDVQELPAILSLALKQWFAEVVDVAA
ncbi:conserved hypothetical protein [Histoplasma mississippiense (nom. inval.)]|uniref:conserved hypothetical protein n=1 Tax=Ajellomyces capsulatus (strain NAm1 / WU24) TaxID=2059318 RepID=UPI000157D6C0|nr:conserved hypothetical protein [Histoplasma mississippiense (nom. inval.)]EDN07367.1 conserved hypothetical protein [Histoplasma mississippiense (nom. inval.)]